MWKLKCRQIIGEYNSAYSHLSSNNCCSTLLMRDGKLSGCPTPMSRRLEHRNTSRRSFILFCCPWPVRAALYPSSGYIKDKNKLIEEGVSSCDVVYNDKNVRENNRVSNLISFYESLSKVCNFSSNI